MPSDIDDDSEAQLDLRSLIEAILRSQSEPGTHIPASIDLTMVTNLFGALTPELVEFLRQRPHLVPALARAHALILKHFDESTKLSLELTDQSSEYPNLFIQIHTRLPQPAAAARSEQFEESWFDTESAANLVDLTANLVFV